MAEANLIKLKRCTHCDDDDNNDVEQLVYPGESILKVYFPLLVERKQSGNY